MDRDGLGDLQKANQLKRVQPLGAGLVAMHLREPRTHGRVGRNQTVDVREPEVSANAVHHRHDRGIHQAPVTQAPDVQLDVLRWTPHQGVERV